MKIVTSIHVYNFHLIISYLMEGIQIIPFNDFRYNFRRLKIEYPQNISLNKSLNEIITYNQYLFGLSNSNLYSFQLNNPQNDYERNIFENENKVSQLSLDFDNNDLYILSEDSGIQEINIFHPNHPKYLKQMVPNSFNTLGNPVISNMISRDKIIYLSIRGFGATKIHNYPKETMNEVIFRTEDAQDVNFLKNLNIVIVADGIEGLIFFEHNSKNPIRKIKLFDGDFPQQIRIYNSNLLIKGKKGLYTYNIKQDYLKKIWEGSVGVMTAYYNYIFFSSKGQLNLISDADKSLSYFELNDNTEIDIKINRPLM